MTSSKCPFCSCEFEVEDDMIGRRGQCYSCGNKFTIEALAAPAAAAVPEAPPPAPPPPVAPRSAPTAATSTAARPAPSFGAQAHATPTRRKSPLVGALSTAALLALCGGAWWLLRDSTQPSAQAGEQPAAITPAEPAQDGPLGAELATLLTAGDFRALQSRLIEALTPDLTGDDGHVDVALRDPVKLTGLAQCEIIRQCTPEQMKDVLAKPNGAAFLGEFLRSPEWMESFLVSDPPAENFGVALEHLRLLSERGADLHLPVYRRLATAMALSGGKTLPYRMVDRFQHVQQAHRELLLHASFDELDVREMRWAVYFGGNREDYQYLLDDRQTTIDGYFGSCWACWYRGHNDFGDTVQGPLYYLPWSHAWPGWERARQVGGVCGSLSTFGSMSARAHGVPSTPVGQPGHCAYIIRKGDEWPVAYSVTWPTGASTPGWEGTGYSTLHRLYEKVQNDREAFRKANHLVWAARFQADVARPDVRVLPGVTYTVYSQGIGTGLPDFTKLTPAASGTVDRVKLSDIDTSSGGNFGVVWEGQIEVGATGGVSVATHSDDGSRVLIDGEAVVNANCTRDVKTLNLTPGRHALRVEYCQGGGAFYHTLELEGVLPPGQWARTYERATHAQPVNFGVWLEYLKTLDQAPSTSPSARLELLERIARTFSGYPEAGWALIHRTMDKAFEGVDPARRLVTLTDCHRHLTQAKAERFEAFPYDGVLNRQADQLGDPQLAVRFFEQVLKIHSAKAPYDWIFGQVLNWGQTRFARDPKTAPQYAAALESFFRGQGGDMNADLLRNQVTAGIRNAGESGDAQSFRLWSDMAEALLPALKPQDVHLNDGHVAAFPKREPFPGELLSRDAVLKVNQPCQFDKPASYRALLRDTPFGGYLDTEAIDNPSVIVQLPGDGAISGIVIVDRYEFPGEADWSVPIQVSLSTDGKTWTPAGLFETAQPLYRLDLAGKDPRARYVKLERPPGKTTRFHLRNILVYGKRLY